MSDSYNIDGVKITPSAGGYYDLEHSSLPNGEPERVRGKEKAEARASEIAQAAEPGDGHIPPQGTLQSGQGGDIVLPGDTRSAAERQQENLSRGMGEQFDATRKPDEEDKTAAERQADRDRENADVAKTVGAQQPPAPRATGDDKDQAIAALRAENAETKATLDQILKALKPATEAAAAATVEEPENQVPLTIPREFAGEMESKVRAALKKAGIETSVIVLEENDSIPPTGLFIGHNGRSYMIKPGEEVEVPDFLLSVLDDAVMSAPVVDSTSQKVLGYRNRSKYPYRRVS